MNRWNQNHLRNGRKIGGIKITKRWKHNPLADETDTGYELLPINNPVHKTRIEKLLEKYETNK